MNRLRYMAAWTALATLLAGCMLLPQSFNEGLAGGYKTVETIADTATSLHQSGTLSDADGAQVLKQDENLKAGLDIARSLHETDPDGGDAKLSATLVALTALQNYLRTRQ